MKHHKVYIQIHRINILLVFAIAINRDKIITESGGSLTVASVPNTEPATLKSPLAAVCCSSTGRVAKLPAMAVMMFSEPLCVKQIVFKYNQF